MASLVRVPVDEPPATEEDVANPLSPQVRLNSICPYYTMFPLTFPYGHLADAGPGEWVLDPFCGRGTTNYAARLRGLPTAGIDSNPVAVAIAEAKLLWLIPDDIIAEAASILTAGNAAAGSRAPSERDGNPDRAVPSGPFWEWAFHPRTLEEICIIREALLEQCTTPARKGLRALMLGILHGPRRKGAPSYLSNQMPRTYATKPDAAVRFWQRRGLKPSYVNTLDLIQRRARYSFAAVPPPVTGTIAAGDSRDPATYEQLPDVAFSWVITSPPYLGMRFYRSDQWLRNWFLGGPADVDYTLEGQMGRYTGPRYEEDLARVWRLVARRCSRGARLIVRFGTLPSVGRDPESLLVSSLERADVGWRVTAVRGAGRPARGRRQAEQFSRPGLGPEEIDLEARLT